MSCENKGVEKKDVEFVFYFEPAMKKKCERKEKVFKITCMKKNDK